MTGRIFDIQRFSIGNGPGVRTTVFLKGCPLRCKWCHNPEALSPEPQIKINGRLCRKCGLCGRVCPQGVHVLKDGIHTLHTERCIGCGKCENVCCYGCVSLIGSDRTPEETADIVLADRIYYEKSGGGVTFSGGEPMLQYEFIEAVAGMLKGVSIYIDTCGYCDEKIFFTMLHHMDGVLFDLKHMDNEKHKILTGVGNEKILANFAAAVSSGIPLQVRYPMIPGANDDDENISRMCALLLEYGITHLEVSPYHDFGTQKYRELGQEPHFFPAYTQSGQEDRLKRIERMGIIPTVI